MKSSSAREVTNRYYRYFYGSGPPFRKVRHSESRHSRSLQGIVLDIATIRRLTLTLSLTLTLTVTVRNGLKWRSLGNSEWRADTISTV